MKHLFKFDSDEITRAELLIILTPHVIRSSADSERLKHVETARMHWCESDVYRIHGDINVSSIDLSDHIDSSDPPVIYPDLNPSGELQPVEVAPVESLPRLDGVRDIDSLLIEDALEMQAP